MTRVWFIGKGCCWCRIQNNIKENAQNSPICYWSPAISHTFSSDAILNCNHLNIACSQDLEQQQLFFHQHQIFSWNFPKIPTDCCSSCFNISDLSTNVSWSWLLLISSVPGPRSMMSQNVMATVDILQWHNGDNILQNNIGGSTPFPHNF